MLLAKVPRSSSPNSQPAIAFDQCLRERMAQLGLEEAELVTCYTTHLQADRNSTRSIPIKALRGESDPTLATVIAMLHSEVLNGELMLQWGKDDGFVVPDPEAISFALRERVIELGLDPAAARDLLEVTRRYLVVRYGDHDHKPWNHIKTIQQAIGDSPNPRVQTFIQIVQGLGGQVLIRWVDTVRRSLPADKIPPDLKEISGAKSVILEFQEWSDPVVLSGN